jgi:ATP-dependent Clp protease ATP-binding subunit ClpA
MNIDIELQDILNKAYGYARTKKHDFFTPEHILYVTLNFAYCKKIMQYCQVDIHVITRQLETYFDAHFSIVDEENHEPSHSSSMRDLFSLAAAQADKEGLRTVSMHHIIVAFFALEESYAAYYMVQAGATEQLVVEAIKNIPRQAPIPADDDRGNTETNSSSSNRQALNAFTQDLNQAAKRNEIEPVVGRDEEFERLYLILARRTKSNPLLIGEAGVGKTALIHGLAHKIVQKKVPSFLQGWRIYSLDIGALMAGTRYRGDFEERMKGILKDIKTSRQKIILFIDEIHMIVGTGSSGGESMDIGNMLKPVLSSNNFKCIGSTTLQEHKKLFAKDRALSRRFQNITIGEPSLTDSYQILHGAVKRYESYHKVVYTPDALKAAVDLSAQYITDRYLPDKAFDVMDEAGALVKMQKHKTDHLVVDVPFIEQVIAQTARIPLKSVKQVEKIQLLNLEQELKNAVFGQDKAVSAMAQAIKRARAGLRKADKPMGSFLFVGSTGVGKTELAKTLANVLRVPLLRFDMSEYQEKHTVARLLGAPAGYVGYEEGGLLTDALSKQPHSVLLLDEIEKAHRDIYNILLSAMDYATITDAQGRKVDLRHVVIIMTSNVGAQQMTKGLIGFETQSLSTSVMMREIENTFSPEFRNRLDKIIVFNPLSPEAMHSIVRKELLAVTDLLKEQNVTLSYSDNAVEYLAQKGYDRTFGARPLGRLIEDEVKEPLVHQLLEGSLVGKKVILSCRTHGLSFQIKKQQSVPVLVE